MFIVICSCSVVAVFSEYLFALRILLAPISGLTVKNIFIDSGMKWYESLPSRMNFSFCCAHCFWYASAFLSVDGFVSPILFSCWIVSPCFVANSLLRSPTENEFIPYSFSSFFLNIPFPAPGSPDIVIFIEYGGILIIKRL